MSVLELKSIRELGNSLRIVRQASGMSQADVAALARIGHTSVSAFELNHKRPSVETFLKLCRAMGAVVVIKGGSA